MSMYHQVSGWLQEAVRDHWLALLILVVPINWVVYQADKAENVLPMLILPLTAFAVGFWLRPRHVWLIWLGSVVIQWVVMGAWGTYADAGPDETVASLILEAFGWMAFGVMIPVWLGRLARDGVELGWHADRGQRA